MWPISVTILPGLESELKFLNVLQIETTSTLCMASVRRCLRYRLVRSDIMLVSSIIEVASASLAYTPIIFVIRVCIIEAHLNVGGSSMDNKVE